MAAHLTAAELAFCIVASAVVLVAVEIAKMLIRAGVLYRTQTTVAPLR